MARKRLTLIDDLLLSRLSEQATDSADSPSYAEWIRLLRTYLRMTQVELARRARLPQSHLAAIEGGKVDPQVRTLQRIFDALSCDTVLAPKPRLPLDQVLRSRAREIALKRLNHSVGTMALEEQAPDPDLFLKLIEKRTDEILNDHTEKLWNRPDE